jgi:hypothetical protein
MRHAAEEEMPLRIVPVVDIAEKIPISLIASRISSVCLSKSRPGLLLEAVLPQPEGATQAYYDNEDATEDHYEIADAKQSQLSLVCQKGKLRFGCRSVPHRAQRMECRGHSDNRHRSCVGVGHGGI